MPIVTVSRQFGSGGSEVAERVARTLGWTLLDNALIDAVAVRLGTTTAEVSRMDERGPSLVERLAEAMTLGTPEWVPAVTETPPSPSQRLVEVTRRVVEEAVSHGPLVVVGRGAQAMLAERHDALHIFCFSTRAALVARVAGRERIDARAAERLIDDTNKQRALFVREHFRRDWSALENYDVCVNTGTLGVDGAADVVSRAAAQRIGRSSGRR
ncbi:MAG: cytidylate kinase-like family protein [Gemmatimonadaceae bacterium]